MLTDLEISKNIETKTIEPNPWAHFGGYGGTKKTIVRAKSVYEAKQEICRKLESYGCPPYKSGEVKVELTHKNMGDIAKHIEEYKKIAFKKFDKALTVWMRQSNYDGQDDRGLWDKLTSAPRVRQLRCVQIRADK
jgi:hypothetical protein